MVQAVLMQNALLISYNSGHMISILRTYLWELPPALASPITAILQNSHATPGDIFAVSPGYTVLCVS
jgi:hypothetical protein